MLILSRKEDQSVTFPSHGIVVYVVSIRGKTIKLGVVAPDDVAVVRSELTEDTNKPFHEMPKVPNHTERLQDLKGRLKSVTEAVRLVHDLKSIGQYRASEKKFNELLDMLAEYDAESLIHELPLAVSDEVAIVR